MKNCRNCKHAGWMRSEKGRKLYGNYAACKAEIDTSMMPASAWQVLSIIKGGRRGVLHGNEDIKCPRWEKENKP